MTNASGTAWFDDIRLSPGNLITKTQYDSNGNYVTSTTDQQNRTTTFGYNPNDNYGLPTTAQSQSGAKVQYTYDGLNRLVQAIDNANNSANYNLDANGNVTVSNLSGTYDYETVCIKKQKECNRLYFNYLFTFFPKFLLRFQSIIKKFAD